MAKKEEFTFTWVIENFNLFPPKNGESLDSPDLLIRNFLSTKWSLRLYPGGFDSISVEHISVYLRRSNDDGPENIEMDCLISINGEIDKLDTTYFKKDYSYGWPKFMRRKDVKEFSDLVVECHMQMNSNSTMTADYTHESTDNFMPCFLESQFMIPEFIKETSVTVEREISSTGEVHRQYCNQGFVRIRVSAEKRIVICAIKDYLCPGKERKQYIFVKLPSATVILKLFTITKDDNDFLEIEICVQSVHQTHCLLVCKIELLDFLRKVHITAEEEHLFKNKDHKIWNFGQPFKWNDIKDKKEASLRVTLTYSDGHCLSDIERYTKVDDYVGLLNFNNDVNKDLHRMFIEKRLCDVTVRVQDKSIEAHKTVLGSRSPVFAAMFENGRKENDTTVIEIDDLESNTVNQMLIFMYTGNIGKLNTENAMQLFSAADKYQIVHLKDTCRNVLKNNLTVPNICSVLLFADALQDEQLMECCVSFIFNYREKIVVSEDWEELEENHVSLALNTLKKISRRPFP